MSIRNKMGVLAAMIFLQCMAIWVQAQEGGPGVELNVSTSAIKQGDSAMHVETLELRALFPLVKGGRSRLMANFSWTNEHFIDFPAVYGARLNGFSAGGSWIQYFDGRHWLSIAGDIGVYSDGKIWRSGAIREKGSVVYFARYSRRLALGYGIFYRNQFYGNQLSPVVIVLYSGRDSSSKWKLSGVLPYTPRLTYQVDKRNGVSLSMRQVFSSYLLSAEKDSGNFVRNQKVTIALNYEYGFAAHWRIYGGVGYALKQTYEVYRGADARLWYLFNTPLGSRPTPLASISHRGVQWNIGIAYHPGL